MIHLSSIKLPTELLQVTILNETTTVQEFNSSHPTSSTSSNCSGLQALDAFSEHTTEASNAFLSRREQLFDADGSTSQEVTTTLQQGHGITALQWTVFNTLSHFFVRCKVAFVTNTSHSCLVSAT